MRNNVRFLLLTILTFCLNACSLLDKGALSVTLMDVGQGEAIGITCPDGITQTLIDGGQSSTLYPGAEDKFYSALTQLMGSDGHIEYVINTHPHTDHLTGIANLLTTKNYSIGKYFDNGSNYPGNNLATTIRKLVEEQNIPYQNLSQSKPGKLHICPNQAKEISLELLWLSKEEEGRMLCPENLNDCSIVTKLRYQELSILLLADVTLTWENVALRNPGLAKSLVADVLKVGHHGSESTGSDFIKLVDPQFSVISTGQPRVGSTELYSFPRVDVVKRLNEFHDGQRKLYSDSISLEACLWLGDSCHWDEMKVNPRIFSTAADGNVHMLFDGRCIEIKGEKSKRMLRYCPNR